MLKTNIPVNTEIGKLLKKSKNPNATLEHFLNTQTNTICIYTDGSRKSDAMSVGCACVCKSPTISVKRSLDITASTYTAECLALSEALDIALRNPLNNYKILTH